MRNSPFSLFCFLVIWILCFIETVISQWVPAAATIPDQAIAISPDGLTALFSGGI